MNESKIEAMLKSTKSDMIVLLSTINHSTLDLSEGSHSRKRVLDSIKRLEEVLEEADNE